MPIATDPHVLLGIPNHSCHFVLTTCNNARNSTTVDKIFDSICMDGAYKTYLAAVMHACGTARNYFWLIAVCAKIKFLRENVKGPLSHKIRCRRWLRWGCPLEKIFVYVLFATPCCMKCGICGFYCHTIRSLNLLVPCLTFVTKLFPQS